jgi:hypothetical protein
MVIPPGRLGTTAPEFEKGDSGLASRPIWAKNVWRDCRLAVHSVFLPPSGVRGGPPRARFASGGRHGRADECRCEVRRGATQHHRAKGRSAGRRCRVQPGRSTNGRDRKVDRQQEGDCGASGCWFRHPDRWFRLTRRGSQDAGEVEPVEDNHEVKSVQGGREVKPRKSAGEVGCHENGRQIDCRQDRGQIKRGQIKR